MSPTICATCSRRYDMRKIAFDRWGWRHLRPWLVKAGFSDNDLDTQFVEFGQGMQSMSPALRELESDLLNGKLAHGKHPVLTIVRGECGRCRPTRRATASSTRCAATAASTGWWR